MDVFECIWLQKSASKIGVDTAENEPLKIWGDLFSYSLTSLIFSRCFWSAAASAAISKSAYVSPVAKTDREKMRNEVDLVDLLCYNL